MQTIQEELLAMSEKELLAELILELRQNTDAIEELRDIHADTHGLLKEAIWDRTGW